MTHGGPGLVATRVQVTDELAVQVELAEGMAHVVFASARHPRQSRTDPRQASWSAHTPIDHRGLTEAVRSLMAEAPRPWVAVLGGKIAWRHRAPAVVDEVVEGLEAEVDRQVQAILGAAGPWDGLDAA